MLVSRRSIAIAFTFVLALSGAAAAQSGKVVVEQSGNQNDVFVEINDAGAGQAEGSITQRGDGALSDIYIEGEDNDFHVTQTGGGTAYGEVYGVGNSFTIDQIDTQSDAYQNYASILQSGDGNSGELSQLVGAYGGGVNRAYIYQYGDGNNAGLEQSGINNTGTVLQTGVGNNALLSQTGANNSGTVIQNGDGLSGELNQVGNNLDYTVTQNCISGVCDQAIIVNQTSTGAFVTSQTGAGS